MNNEIFYGIALSLIKGIGDANAKTLISYAGSAEQVLKTPSGKLKHISGVGPKLLESLKDTKQALFRAEAELKFIEKNKIDILFYYDKCYPKRLFNCPDAPMYICCKGNYDFNKERFVNIVGTRHATEHGKSITEKLIADLAPYKINLVSGLAFGIDICAHKSALSYDIQNIAVLAHGLDRIYPFQHSTIAEKLQHNGALVTDFLSQTLPDKQNFPRRNRIVAGMTDATIVVESAESGGALITAEIANAYNKDVFAFPGRVQDQYSAGCLTLIKKHKAALVTSAKDIIENMNWDDIKKNSSKSLQQELFVDLNENEKLLFDLLMRNDKMHIDDISIGLALPLSVVNSLLFQLEMKNVVKSLHGMMYKLSD